MTASDNAREVDVAGLVQRIEKAQEWMRAPDWDERFSFSDMTRWINDRPTSLLPNVAAVLRSAAERTERLEERLRELEETGAFLADRIAELDWCDWDQHCREWERHVSPALARFVAALRHSGEG